MYVYIYIERERGGGDREVGWRERERVERVEREGVKR